MSLIAVVGSVWRDLRNSLKTISVYNNKYSRLEILSAELIRNTHSIEKGLCIKEPRLGFGHEKQKEMINQIEVLSKESSPYYQEVCQMAISALEEYLIYHREREYTDDFCKTLETFVESHKISDGEKKGGTITVNKESLCFDIDEIEHFFMTRHSIRDFDPSPVNENALEKALHLAQRAPSACNRQGVRAYVLNNKQGEQLAKLLSGVGGFAEQVGRYIVITGKKSAYRLSENNQYVVSASIYAAYLTLTLHLYGLGACIIQRPVIWSKMTDKLAKDIGADRDEQIVCILAVGNLKESFKVPFSQRIDSVIKMK